MTGSIVGPKASHFIALPEITPAGGDAARGNAAADLPNLKAGPVFRTPAPGAGSNLPATETAALGFFRFPWESSPERERVEQILQQPGPLSAGELEELNECLNKMDDGEFADSIESMTPAQLRQYLSGMSDSELKAFTVRAGETLSPEAREALFERMVGFLDNRQITVLGAALQGTEAIGQFTAAVIATGDAQLAADLLRTLSTSSIGGHNDNAIAQLLQHLVESGRTDLVTGLLNDLPEASAARLLDGLAASDLSFEERSTLFEELTRILSPELLTSLLPSLSPKSAAHLLLAAQDNPALLDTLLRNMPTDLLEAALYAIGQGAQGIHPPDQVQAINALFAAASRAGISADAKANLFTAAAAHLQRMADNGVPMLPGEQNSFANLLLDGMTALLESDGYAVVEALSRRSGSEDYFGYELASYTSIMLSMGRSAELAGVVESFTNSAQAAGEAGATPQELASIIGAFYGGLQAGYNDANAAARQGFEEDLARLGFVIGVTPIPGNAVLAFLATLTIAISFEAAGHIDFPDVHGAAPSLEEYFDQHPDLEDYYDAALGRVVTPETYGGEPENDWPPGNHYLEGR